MNSYDAQTTTRIASVNLINEGKFDHLHSGTKRLRIAQVGPLYESTPPKFYGGTERVVSYITEELVRRGHDVTLFASGDAETKAHLVAACPQALRLIEKPYLGVCLQLPMISGA